MKKVSNGFRLAVFVLLVTTLFAAPLFAEGQNESASGGEQQMKTITMALGDIESIEVLHLLIALERVKEQGVDVNLVSYKSEDVASQAVVNGQADIGIGTPYALIQNVGAPIRIFMQIAKINFYAVVNANDYNSWADLDGHEIVVHSRTSATLALAMLMAQKHNIEYSKISYVPGSEVRAVSLLRGNIKATILDSYNKDYVMKQAPGKFKVLPLGDFVASDEALFANTNYLEANSEVVQILIEELLRTVREIDKNPQVVLELRKKYNLLPDLPSDLEPEILPYYQTAAKDHMFPEDGGGAKAARQDFELYGAAGEIKGNPQDLKVENFWDLTPLDNALKDMQSN